MKKTFITSVIAAITAFIFCIPVFAAEWVQDDMGWWYAVNDEKTQWYSDGWYWIDGNSDGIFECYCFDRNGYIYTDGLTPDNYTVDKNGAWTVGGAVQKKEAPEFQKELPAALPLTEEQKAVVREILPYMIKRFEGYHGMDFSSDPFYIPSGITGTLYASDLTVDDVMDYLYSLMFWQYIYSNSDSAILIPINHDPLRFGETSFRTYQGWCDKDSAIKNIGDFFNKPITESDIFAKKYYEYNEFCIDGNALGIMIYSGGEGESVIDTEITSYDIEGPRITLNIAYNVLWETVPEDNYQGKAVATLITNPDSFFGYSFESLSLDI